MATASMQLCRATGTGHSVQGCRKPPFIISTAISAPAPLSSVATCPPPAHRLPMPLLPCQVTVKVNLHDYSAQRTQVKVPFGNQRHRVP